MAVDTTVTSRLNDIASKLETIAGIEPGAAAFDAEITTRLKRIYDAIIGGVLDAHPIPAHTDVLTTMTPTARQFLGYDGTQWDALTPLYTDLGDPIGLPELTDVLDTLAPTTRQFLGFDGSSWDALTPALPDLSDVGEYNPVLMLGGEVLAYVTGSTAKFIAMLLSTYQMNDMSLSNPLDGKILVYDGSLPSGKWVGVTFAAAGFSHTDLQDIGTKTHAQIDTHIGSDGSDHGFIDQDVKSGTSPTFDGTNFTGIPDGALDESYILADGTRELTANWDAGAYSITALTLLGDSTGTAGQFAGDVKIEADSKKLYFGAADDAWINYDGLDCNINTGDINPSDLVIDCGTEKTVELAEPVWEDALAHFSDARAIGALQASFISFRKDAGGTSIGTYGYAFLHTARKEVFFRVQLSHRYKEGTTLHPHIHWSPVDTDVGGVKWHMEYTIASVGSPFPVTEDITLISTATTTGVAYDHIATDLKVQGITGLGIGISAVIIGRLYRDTTSVNDTYGNTAFLHYIDFHYEVDTIGSRQEWTK